MRGSRVPLLEFGGCHEGAGAGVRASGSRLAVPQAKPHLSTKPDSERVSPLHIVHVPSRVT
jgi:hypothetical protein